MREATRLLLRQLQADLSEELRKTEPPVYLPPPSTASKRKILCWFWSGGQFSNAHIARLEKVDAIGYERNSAFAARVKEALHLPERADLIGATDYLQLGWENHVWYELDGNRVEVTHWLLGYTPQPASTSFANGADMSSSMDVSGATHSLAGCGGRA